MPTSPQQHARIEQSVYGHSYAGYRADPLFESNLDRLIARFLAPNIREGGRVLDVGCGAGAFLRAAGRAHIAAQGIEISEAAAQICRDAGCQAEAAEFLTYGENRAFAAITMWDVIEHLREPQEFIRRAFDLLEPGGVFFSKTPIFGSLSVALSNRAPRLAPVLLGAPDHVQYFNADNLARLIEHAGFELIAREEVPEGLRTPPHGGSLRRRVVRSAMRTIARWSGDSNLLALARKPG